jgi:hypothetical protein
MDEDKPLFATGSAVLFEGDVDVQWLEGSVASGCPDQWSPGPVVFARSSTSSEGKNIDAYTRRLRLGHGVARHTLDAGRRFHRRVNFAVRSEAQKVDRREMRIVALELILGDLSTAPVAASESDSWIPAIVVVHLDLPGGTSESAGAVSALRFEHVGNLVAPFFRWAMGSSCEILEHLLTAKDDTAVVVKDGKTFKLSEPGDSAKVEEAGDAKVRLLADPRHDSPAALPLYWILADIAPDKQADDERWGKDIQFYEGEGPGKSIGLKDCIREDRRARRSRVLAELSVKPWATENGGAPSDLQSSDPLPWRNWHVSFGRTGAGFAHSTDQAEGVTNAHRRDDLSSVYVDLIALEMLKDRVIQGFAEVTRDLAAVSEPNRKFRERCMQTWKALVLFTSQYFVRSAGISVRDRDVVHGFHQGVGIDLDRELAQVQDNLGRLAEVARHELEEAKNQRDRDFNRIIGIIATLVIPLSVVPPFIEWFIPLPSPLAALVGLAFIILIGLGVAIPVWLVLRQPGERAEKEDSSGAGESGSGSSS